MKQHKHIWYETSLMQDKKDRISYACKCGSWKVEQREPDYNKLQVVGFGINSLR